MILLGFGILVYGTEKIIEALKNTQKNTENISNQRDIKMKKIITYIMVVIFAFSGMYGSVCNTNEKSSILQKWQEDWGNYEWSDNSISNKSYAFETAYIIIEMIDKDDIDSLKCLYQVLQKDKKHNMAFLNGIIGEPTFEKEAIEKENVKALEFFLHNGVIENNATIIDIDAGQEYSLLELATQKLQEAKAKGDFRAVENYEKIIKLLQEDEAKWIN